MSIIGATVVFMVAGIIVTMMVSGREYVPLFTNIPSDQVSLVVQKLNEKNVPFKIVDSGKTISVPADLLHSTQMAMMAEVGSAKLGTIGLEVFDKQDFGMNSYAQRINFQRALQGELIRAINTLTAVRQSKVLLALPAKKTFLEDGGEPTASVVSSFIPVKH